MLCYHRQQCELVIGVYDVQSPLKKSIESENSFHNDKICTEYLFYSENKENKYPEINIYYGPYECNRIVKYRPEKLHGFITCLKEMYSNVKLIPFGLINTVEVVCMGYVIYRFDIRYLKFNMPSQDDPACLKAVDVITEALNRLYGENNTNKNKTKHERRGTTMSISSKISLSEYDTLLEIIDF